MSSLSTDDTRFVYKRFAPSSIPVQVQKGLVLRRHTETKEPQTQALPWRAFRQEIASPNPCQQLRPRLRHVIARHRARWPALKPSWPLIGNSPAPWQVSRRCSQEQNGDPPETSKVDGRISTVYSPCSSTKFQRRLPSYRRSTLSPPTTAWRSSSSSSARAVNSQSLGRPSTKSMVAA